jgi:hypothetical protein
MESIEQTWNGSSTTNGRCTATISRNGDLVHKMYIEVGNVDSGAGANGVVVNQAGNPGVAWINTIDLEIGGQRIDRHSGAWMETWAELTQFNPTGLTSAAGQNATTVHGASPTLFQNMSGQGGVTVIADLSSDAASRGVNYTVPLQFWFCRNAGLALPLIALQYHEVKVILNHNLTTVFPTADATQTNKLWADYIYLDTDERRRFAQVSHEYLIEQVQEQSLSASTTNELNFNHPVKELIWTATEELAGALTYCELKRPLNAVNDTCLLKLNGHDRFAARAGTYFSRTQVLQHHTGYGGLNSTAVAAEGASNDSICVYSFALKPEEHQPSGTCNFSRIDNAQFITSANVASNALMFAVNYNVLRIMSGMGGLAYSN